MADLYDWSTTPAANTSIDGINCAPGMPVGNVDNVFRAMAAAIRNSFSTALEGFLNGTAALPITSGGTGAPDAATARTNLGLGAAAVQNIMPIANGGTGATTALGALNAIAISSASLANPGYIKLRNGFMAQWGRGTLGPNSIGSITYPEPYTSFSICLAGGGNSSTSTADQVRRYGAATTTGAGIVNPNDLPSGEYEWFAVGV